jgi:4-hydroxy-tetrahydrodipicolinate synthase
MRRITGVIPPVCTPLDTDGSVDTRSLERLVERLLAAGVDGIFALGSSGEAIYLNDADRRKVLEVVVGTVGGSATVFAGALDATPARVVDQIRWIEGSRANVLLVTAPFYANVSDAETTRHFELVSASASLPVLAYDIPGNVGRKLSTQVTIDLLSRDVIAGVKDSSGVMDGLVDVLSATGVDRGSSILTGADVLAADSLAAGADGLVPGLGNVRPNLFVELYAAHLAGDAEAVRRAQAAITTMSGIFGIGERYGLGRHASEIGALKAVLHREGIIASPTTPAPLTPYPAEAVADLERLLGAHGQ